MPQVSSLPWTFMSLSFLITIIFILTLSMNFTLKFSSLIFLNMKFYFFV